MKKICYKCATEIKDDGEFCKICGAPTARKQVETQALLNNICPVCHTTYGLEFKFCQNDGEMLLPSEALLPSCVLCNTRYPKEVTICPKDGAEVSYNTKVKTTPAPKNSSTVTNTPKKNSSLKIFSFKGRINRTSYLFTVLMYCIVNAIIIANTTMSNLGIAIVVFSVFNLLMSWILLAQAAKRSHDIGNSGWYVLIPFYGAFILFLKGAEGTNQYGSSPK
ncbi:DUF805 domain-containing protein [Cellulophaga sp. E16_2]|uniref:DUF805 domain-containing protein n=1 Tax=Cellulophaga sp. E16_2 TaxID=2789297 RepID=UPI001A934345|nr:DUF805 domain-containing protein [Cellulophaga sp. E16_2]MBO0590472.1 DUF805 domain-containing protein [Cellulophaga sp. E16_2]